MDWFSIINQVVTKEKDFSEELDVSEESEDAISEEFTKPEGNLSELERAGLICALHYLSLQLCVLHARSPGNAVQSNKTSAKKLHEITEATILEMAENGTFDHLYLTAKEEMTKRRGDSEIEKRKSASEKRMKHLKLQIRSNDIVNMREMNKKQEIIASLKDEIQNLIAKSESRSRFMERWENARQGANRKKCDKAETSTKIQLERLSTLCNEEIKVNDKICVFLTEQIDELENELTSWMEKYHAEMKRREERIKGLHKKSEEQLFRIKELKQLSRQREMDEYLRFKEERRLEEERNRFMYESATKIQAWWRGTMVRRGLGPYKKRKKAVKDKKKKDK